LIYMLEERFGKIYVPEKKYYEIFNQNTHYNMETKYWIVN